jgi:hypothetical protein
MIATLLLAVHVATLFPVASLPTIKTNCPTEIGWASADFLQISVMSNRVTPIPARCRRVERLRRIGRALRDAVEATEGG